MSLNYGRHSLLLAVLLIILPLNILAQENDDRIFITLSYQKQTLKTVLDDISSQSGVLFVYNSGQINDNVKIDIKAKRKNLNDVLSQISDILDFTFVRCEKQIIIKPRKTEVSSTEDSKTKNAVISGYIRDVKTQEFLIGATISVEGHALGTATNAYGYYSLPLMKGEYTLIFSYLGYKREYVKINLTGSVSINKALEMIETPLDAVSISSESFYAGAKESLNSPGSSITVKDFMEYSGLVLSGDLVGILATDHGITRVADGSAFYCARGGCKDQNLILIDDAPVYHPSHLFGFFSSVSSDAISAIDVYTSDFPIRYGGRLSSITDIRTKDGILGKFKIGGEVMPFAVSALTEVPLKQDKITSTVNFRKSILGWIPLKLDRKGKNGFYDVNAKIHFRLSNKNRLYLSFYGSKDYYNDLNTTTDYAVIWYNTAATIRNYHIISDKIFMNNSIYMGRYDYKIYTNDVHTNYWTTGIQNFSYKSDFVYNITPANTIRFGGEYSFHLFTPARLYTEDNKTGTGLLTGNADDVSSYLGVETRITKKMAFKIGTRINFWGNYGAAKSYFYNERTMMWDTISYPKGRFKTTKEFEPRVALVYKPMSNMMLKLSCERNVQFLHTLSNSISPFTTLDLWIPSGNYFKPQSANCVTFSSDLKLRDLSFSFNAYYKYAENLTEYTFHANMLLNQTIENEFYLGKSKIYGAEFSVEKKAGALHLKAFYAYSYSRRLTPELYHKEYIADNCIPHTIHLMLSYKITKKISAKADWNFNTGIPYTKPVGFYYYEEYKIPYYGARNNARLPDYHKMNLAFEYILPVIKPNGKFFHSLTLSIYNIYNRVNFVMVSYNKVKTPSGSYVIPSNYIKDNQFLATGLSLPGIMPVLSYKFRY